VARVSARTDIGSWTLVIVCQLLDPEATAASTVVSDTPRMPSATILVATGAAYTTAAAIAVNRLAANKARNGTRYTNAGMVWAASRTGRMIRSAW